jgi:hypothetical protein
MTTAEFDSAAFTGWLDYSMMREAEEEAPSLKVPRRCVCSFSEGVPCLCMHVLTHLCFWQRRRYCSYRSYLLTPQIVSHCRRMWWRDATKTNLREECRLLKVKFVLCKAMTRISCRAR